MTHGPTYFPTKGACIYCRATSVKLTNEHIVPYSLGGQHVIREASCNQCSDITTKFEDKVARGMWGDARASFNAPSRKKHERPEFILMTNPDSRDSKIKVPTSEYSAAFIFYEMPPPGILQGLAEDVDVSNSWKMKVIDDEQRRTEFLKKFEGKLTIKFLHSPQAFGQLLCKIAYCHLLSELDLDDFKAICLPYIMGEKQNISHIVGGTDEVAEPTPGIGYSLNTSGLISNNKLLIIVKVRLYANTYAPQYQVVTGEVEGDLNIRNVLKKFGPLTITPIVP